MKTRYCIATSLDGFIADPENSLDWLMQFGDVEGTGYPAFIREVGALAMGSTTYEWLLRHEIRPDSDEPKPWPYAQPTWVFTSRDLPRVPGADLRFVSGAVEPVYSEIAGLLAEGLDLWLVGGGELVGMFLDAGLLDELHLGVAPVFLAGGAPLLPRRLVTPPLELVGCSQAGPFAQLDYRVVRSGLTDHRPQNF